MTVIAGKLVSPGFADGRAVVYTHEALKRAARMIPGQRVARA